MKFQGSCHCRRIAYEVEGDLSGVTSCNCSMCSRKGVLMWFVPRERLRLLTPEKDMATYTFNKHVIKHRFCPVCGIHPFGEAVDPKGNPMAAVNIRCLERVDVDAVPVTLYDGRSK